jgi:uroporphyrinogen decarboxylase
VEFLEGEGPRLQPLRSASDLDNLRISGLTERLAPVYKTVAGVAGALPPATALIGFAGAPWTVGSYMVEGGGSKDFLVARTFAHAEPLVFRRLIAILVDATIDHLSAQIAAGAETVQLFDSWAGALSEDQFRKWVIAPTRAIVATLKARYPKVPVIGFPRGAGAMLTAYAHETGVSAVGLDTQMPVGWAVDNLSTGFPIQGNLDPAALVVGGQALEDGVTHILQQAGARPLIFNLGHGVPMNTPPDHVARLVELVRA